LFVVTLNPHTTVGRYFGPQLVVEGDWYELTDAYLVIFAAADPAERRGGKRFVLVLPREALLAIDES
jgi:hypothetical protein